MATGIEIAGIVLAVAPLCFTVLKNYENDLRPYRALVKLRNEYAASERDLRLRFVILSMQMETLLLQSGIWNEGQTMEAYVKTYSSDIWDNAAQKEKLVAHLGILEYEHGFETILRYIRKHISEIASVLGLGAFGESDRDGEIWTRIQEAADCQKAIDHRSNGTFEAIKAQCRFVLRSGTIQRSLENLDRDIKLLALTVQTAGSRQGHRTSMSSVVAQTTTSASRTTLPKFSPSLANIRNCAQRIHDSLQKIRACPRRDTHRINLRLDQRFKSRNTSSSEGTRGAAYFNLICESCNAHNHAWRTLDILVTASQGAGNDDDDEPDRHNSREVRFAPNLREPTTTLDNREGVSDLCSSITKCEPTTQEKARFFLDSRDRILEGGRVDFPRPDKTLPITLISLRNQIQRARTWTAITPPLTAKHSVSLGADIVSAILQLSSTPWFADVWSCDDVYLIQSYSSGNAIEAYVPMSIGPNVPQASNAAITGTNGLAFMRLSIILLELAVRTTIETIGITDLCLTAPISPTDRWRYITNIEALITRAGTKHAMEPCFQQAIDYCLHAAGDYYADIRAAKTQQEMIENILVPFESALQDL